jgi:hypothetical protein
LKTETRPYTPNPVVRRSQTIDGSTKARFDLHLDEVTSALVICERLKKTPVPLVYTRHTGRFLGLWILTLPFALANELNSHFVMVPIATLVAVFFFGIEELGIREYLSITFRPCMMLASIVRPKRPNEKLTFDSFLPLVSRAEIEEPFSILPIDDVIQTIDSRLCQVCRLRHPRITLGCTKPLTPNPRPCIILGCPKP